MWIPSRLLYITSVRGEESERNNSYVQVYINWFTSCSTGGNDSTEGIVSYTQTVNHIVTDLQGISAVVGRVEARGKWIITDRTRSLITTLIVPQVLTGYLFSHRICALLPQIGTRHFTPRLYSTKTLLFRRHSKINHSRKILLRIMLLCVLS